MFMAVNDEKIENTEIFGYCTILILKYCKSINYKIKLRLKIKLCFRQRIGALFRAVFLLVRNY